MFAVTVRVDGEEVEGQSMSVAVTVREDYEGERDRV